MTQYIYDNSVRIVKAEWVKQANIEPKWGNVGLSYTIWEKWEKVSVQNPCNQTKLFLKFCCGFVYLFYGLIEEGIPTCKVANDVIIIDDNEEHKEGIKNAKLQMML